MSLNQEKEFSEKYKENIGTESYWVTPHTIGHYFMDWLSAWITENPENEIAIRLNKPGYPKSAVEKAFKIFTGNLEKQSVKMPEDLQKEALSEYLRD